MDTAIQLTELTKHYGRTRALNDLSLDVATGEVYGFLGPNGAGKSTTIRIMLDLLRADSGTAVVLGLDSRREARELHRRVAYVPGDVSLWPRLTGGQAIDVLLALNGGGDEKRRADLVERFQLDPTVRGKAYSKGNRQKVALVAALASRAELLVLDEPTSGLDPLMESVFQDCVREAKREGRTVFLSSHILAEAEALCDRVGIIKDGALVESGTLSELRHLSMSAVEAHTARPPRADLDHVAGITGLTVVPERDGYALTCHIHPDATPELLAALTEAGVRTLVSRPPSLEELFLGYYAGDPGDPDADPARTDGAARSAGSAR
ncbi:MAG TPA: ABC transporter ATP-binding protein [Streptosporangiaceae bacterium]